MLDSRWVRKILKGDKSAGEQLIAENYARIFRMLRSLTGRTDAAEDLTQQTFLKAWQGMETFRNRARLATWLHSIAYHEYTHWLRSLRVCAPLEAAANVVAIADGLDLDSLILPGALDQLPAEQRDAFLLFYVESFSISEIASILEVPCGTVKSRLHVARRRLREILQPASELTAPADRAITAALVDSCSRSQST